MSKIHKLRKLGAAEILQGAITGQCQVTCYILAMNMHATVEKLLEAL
jgi:hypothetical protein